MAKLAPVLRQRFLDANGNPLSGGKVFSYLAGTNTPTATFTDQSGATPNANPVILDANGEANIWIGAGSYKFILTNSDDVQQWVVDTVMGTDDAPASEAASLAQAAQAVAEQAKDDAETAETNAAASALAASNSETAAGLSETAAGLSETAAAASALAASNSETAAGISETNAGASEVAAGISETNASNSASAAAASALEAANAASASLWNDVVFLDHTDSPVALSDTSRGKLYVVDATGGAVTINLPSIAGLDLGSPYSLGVKKSDSSSNAITINTNGSDEVRGASSYTISVAKAGVSLIPDTDPTPDAWTAIPFGEMDADSISFDPTGTTLVATNVQAAIAENNSDIDTHIGASIAHGVSGSVVGTTDAQTLTNKTLTAPVVDVASLAEQGSTPTTPTSGTKKFYAKNDGLLYTLDSAGVEVPVGSGGGGDGIENYLDSESANFENALTGATSVGDWTSSDTDKVTITSSSSTPLAGAASGVFTKLAVDAVDAYISVESKTIDRDRRGKPIMIRMSVDADVANYVSEDAEVQLWDITGTPEQIGVSGDTKIKKAKGELILAGFPESTCSKVELRLVVTTDSATAATWAMKIDRISLGPDKAYPSVFRRSEVITLVNSGSNNMSGTFRVSRVGSLVTVTATSTITHTSGSEITSAAGVIPTWAMPLSSTVFNVYSVGGGIALRVRITNTGAIQTRYFTDNLSSASSRTDAGAEPTISYTVEDTESPLLSSTEALYKSVDIRLEKTLVSGVSSSTTVTAFNVVDGNGSELFNATTGVFTPKESGIYLITTRCNTSLTAWASASSNVTISFSGAATAIARAIGGAGTYRLDPGGSRKIPLVAGTPHTFTINSSVSTNFESMTFSITKIPDLSVYGVYGKHEILSAESNSAAFSGSGHWITLTGNSITVPAGIWEFDGQIQLTTVSASHMAVNGQCQWFSQNGGNSTSAPNSVGSLPNATVLNSFTDSQINVHTTTLRTYVQPAHTLLVQVTGGTATIFLNARSVYGASDAPSATVRLWAKRLV